MSNEFSAIKKSYTKQIKNWQIAQQYFVDFETNLYLPHISALKLPKAHSETKQQHNHQ